MRRKEPKWRFGGDEVTRRIGDFEFVFAPPPRRFDGLSLAGLGTLIVTGGILVAEVFTDAGTMGELRQVTVALDHSYQAATETLRSPYERLIEALD